MRSATGETLSVTRAHRRDPQELVSLLTTRRHQGDVDGMVALYLRDAVLDYGAEDPAIGADAIRQVSST